MNDSRRGFARMELRLFRSELERGGWILESRFSWHFRLMPMRLNRLNTINDFLSLCPLNKMFSNHSSRKIYIMIRVGHFALHLAKLLVQNISKSSNFRVASRYYAFLYFLS